MLAGALLAAVRVLVTVLDPESGLPVPGLAAADFVAPSAVVSVAAAEEPLAVLLVLDNSAAGDGLRRTAGEIVARLTEAGYSNVRLSETVDKSILGGLIVRIGSRLYDNSIKSKLQRLQYAMKGAA